MRPYLFDESFPGLANPIGRSCIAYLFARHGDLETAERYVRRSIRQIDDESSYLLLCTRIAAVAELLGAEDLARDLMDFLSPWASHVAVDSHSWWCDGPVAIWLAVLCNRLGDEEGARRHLELGEPIARAMNDVRSLRRAGRIREQLTLDRTAGPAGPSLTARELEVLSLLASGMTNPEIARALTYSVSTIRMDTISIYKKLDVKGRVEAVARANALRLLTP
jgi:ATP/maltotriose-dependent transcriptional regulator MalT